MITRIAHVAYTVADMQKTLHFYCKQLGFTRVFSIPDNNGNPWIEYIKVADGQFIEFFYPQKDYVPNKGSYLHLCLEVRDIHEQARELDAVGIPMRVKPTQGKDGNWQCWVDDPDGNAIEFMQIDPTSPQARA